jgi:ADP-heptose:LPS heptosyltransferase
MSVFMNEQFERTNYFDKSSIHRIGIVRALYLGDMLCSIPAVRALRAAFPNAIITLIGLPWEKYFAERFQHYFNAFIEFPGWPGLPEQEIVPERIVTFLKEMQQQRFDLVVQMQGNGSLTNSMCMLFNARYTAGLRLAGDYTPDEILFPISDDTEHEILRFLKITDALGIPQQGTMLEFPILPKEYENFTIMREQLNLQPGKYICMHPGARNPLRRWSPENFAAIANSIGEQGYTIVLTGSQEEASILQDVASRIIYPVTNIVETLGHIDIGELALIMKNSALLISNDTGVSHVAAALDIPSIIIFSIYSKIERWAPLDTFLHRIISADKAKDVRYVLRNVTELLSRSAATSPEVSNSF